MIGQALMSKKRSRMVKGILEIRLFKNQILDLAAILQYIDPC
jgi:hypothetical protein